MAYKEKCFCFAGFGQVDNKQVTQVVEAISSAKLGGGLNYKFYPKIRDRSTGIRRIRVENDTPQNVWQFND